MNLDASLSIAKGGFRLKVKLNFPLRGVTGMYGRSGCGKSLILRSIAGLDRHRDSAVHLGNTCWQTNGVFIRPHRRNLAYVFQEPCLFSHLSVLGNIDYAYKRAGIPGDFNSPEGLIAHMGLGELKNRSPDSLSGGEKQRAALARALASNPRLILMDEPMTGLDIEARAEIIRCLKGIQREYGIPMLYVSHDPWEMYELADRVLILNGEGPISPVSMPRFREYVDLLLAGCGKAESRDIPLNRVQCQG